MSSIQTGLNAPKMRCGELLRSLQTLYHQIPSSNSSKKADFAREWLSLSESIARQIHMVGEEIQNSKETLDNIVLQPKLDAERLPFLLKTKLDVEQEKRDQSLLEQTISTKQDDLIIQQSLVSESCKEISMNLEKSKDYDNIVKKRQRTLTQYSQEPRHKGFDGKPLLRLMIRNVKKKIKTEESEAIDENPI